MGPPPIRPGDARARGAGRPDASAPESRARRAEAARETRRADGPWPDESQLLLLRLALGGADVAGASLLRWRAAADPAGLDPASRRLLPLAFWNLERHGIPTPGLDVFKRAFAESWVRSHQILEGLSAVLDGLLSAGIPPILFKGAALALGTYPKAALRPMVDVDVLVPHDAFEEAGRVLGRLGARPTSKDPEGRRAMLHGTEHLLEIGGRPLAVDLHRSALWECRRPGDDDSFRQEAVPVPGREDARMLCSSDELLVVCVHGLRWSQLRPVYWIADAMTLIRDERAPVDWERLVGEARRRRLARPVAAALRFLAGAFDAPVPAPAIAALESGAGRLRDRLELACRSRAPQPLRGLFLHWCDHARVSGEGSALARLGTFPGYLRGMWAVGSFREVCALAFRKALHGVGRAPDARFAAGPGDDRRARGGPPPAGRFSRRGARRRGRRPSSGS